VQGVERADRKLLDAAALVGHLVAEGSMFRFLAEHRAELFADHDFADLFPSGRGRPSLPAPVAASILTLQTLYDLSDAETAEAARCDLRWKVAAGMALDDKGFHPSTLVYWRRRLATSARPHRINEAVRRVVEATGILAGRRRRAVDSTIVADAVATQDTVTQLVAAIRRVGREVPGAAERIAAVCTSGGHDYTSPGKPRIDWDDPAAKDALVSGLVNDATALVGALGEVELDERAQAAVALLALVAGQDVEPAEGSDGTDGRWRIARKVAADRVISTVDPDARHTRKSPEARRDGYRAHLAAEPSTGIITDEALTKAAGVDNADAAVAERFVAADTARGTTDTGATDTGATNTGATDTGATDTARGTTDTGATDTGATEWYGDSAYGTGELRDAIARAGHRAVIKPKPLRPAVAGGFTLDDFTVDEAAQTVTCPAGQIRPITPSRYVTFGGVCRGCPLRQRCTTATSGRALQLHPHDHRLRQARHDWAADPRLREDYRQYRPGVERVISQLASRGGRRLKLRYRGTAANHAWLKRRTAALNLRNLIGRGLARWDGAWTLAT
jgi:Transposase DDE domain/Transposase domain (DUF772)